MNRKIYLTLGVGVACLLAVTVARAQIQPTNPGTVNAPVKGTPYLDESFVQGTIVLANNSRTAPVRYNAHKDLIEFQADGQARVLDASSTIKRVSFGEITFVVEKYKEKDITKYGYFNVLDSGKVTLFSKKTVKFTPAMKGRGLDGGDQPAEYRRGPDEFFFKFDGGEMTEIKSIKSMIAAFPDKQDELSAFAKKEKISPRKEAELVKLIQYYNTL
jgi:hypothetical protein